MNELIRYIKKIGMLMILFPMRLKKVHRNRVLLDNCLAHNFSDNIKPIANYLSEHYSRVFEIYVSVNNPKDFLYLRKKGIIPIRYHSFEFYKIAMSSGFFITNSGGYSYLPIRKSQIVINTWHGGGAYKKIGIDSYSVDSFYKKELRLAAKKTTKFLATGTIFAELISKALLIPREIFWEIGMPRNDVLINRNDALIRTVRDKIGLKQNEHLVLYAPTYRKVNDNTFGKSVAIEYGINPNRVCEALEKRFGGTWKFGIRFHPVVKNSKEFDKYDVINLTKYDDMQELLLVADAMINDFSSSMWDYMLTERPSFLYAKDLQHYIDTTAVYIPLDEWPFPKATTNEELENTILEFDADSYKQHCKQHYNQLGGCETGHATQMVCEYMHKLVKNDLRDI